MRNTEEKPIAEYKSERTEIKIYQKEEYTVIEENSVSSSTTISFRNVGSQNKDSAIQFEISKRKNTRNAKTQFTSFSIPESLAKVFLARMGMVFTHQDWERARSMGE